MSPLIEDGAKLIPSVTRVFRKTRGMFVYLEAYERNASATQPVLAFVTFYQGEQKAFETPPIAVTEGLNVKSKAVPLRFSLPLDKLRPGKYQCQVSVIEPGGQKAAFWRTGVMVVP